MRLSSYHSKRLTIFALGLFFLLILNSSFTPAAGYSGQSAADVYKQGAELYQQGKYMSAIERFSQVLILTKDKTMLVDTYFYLSLCNFYLGESDNAKDWIRRIVQEDQGREVTTIYPAGYRDLFDQVRRESPPPPPPPAVRPAPAQPAAPPAYASQPAERKKDGSKLMLYVLGGVVVAGGVAALILLSGGEKTGSIQVNSTPPGAQVFLDGADTGQVSNCTLDDIDEGSHTVRLVKDGYSEVSQSVSVAKKETANVNVTLAAHTIAITNPTAATVWAKGQSVSITWTTGGGAAVQAQLRADMQVGAVSGMSGSAARMNRLRMHRSYAVRGSRVSGRSAGRTARSGVDVGAPVSGTAAQALKGNTPRRDNQRVHHFPGTVNLSGDMESFTLSQVKIELLRGGNVVQTIAASTSNSGSANWTVPASLQDDSNYKVRVSCATDSAISDESVAFTITDTGSLRVNSTPAGATIWIDGVNRGATNQTITGVPVGQRALKLTKERFADWQKTVTINRNQTTTVSATLTAGAFKEDFNDNQAQFWVKGEGKGTWVAQDQVYKLKLGRNSINTSYYTAGKFGNNYSFQAKILQGRTGYSLGTAFGVSNDLKTFFYFDLDPDTRYWSIWKITNNAQQYWELKPWTYDSAIRDTGWNNVKITVNGRFVEFFVNGTRVGHMTINDLPSTGYIGLVGVTQDDSDVVQFDDVIVTLGTAAAGTGSAEVAIPIRAENWDNYKK